MLRAGQRLVAIGTGVALVATLGGPALAAPATPAGRGRPAEPRAYLIHLIDGGDPIVVQKYIEEAGQIRFEKYGGWVAIPSYEVLRIVPDDSDDPVGALPPPVPADSAGPPLYVATRSGATLRATNVGAAGAEVRVNTPEGSLTFHRTDLVGVLRVPAPPGSPEAWITLWGGGDGSGGDGRAAAAPGAPPQAPPPALSDRPHLLQLASGVVIQVDGFWLEAGEIRFRRLGGVVGFALGEIARLLPQEAEPVRGQLAVRFVRRLGPDRVEVRLRQELRRVRLIGVEPVSPAPPGSPASGDRAIEDPWVGLDPWAPGPPRVRPRAVWPRGGLAGLPLPAERANAERRAHPGRPRPAADRQAEPPVRRSLRRPLDQRRPADARALTSPGKRDGGPEAPRHSTAQAAPGS